MLQQQATLQATLATLPALRSQLAQQRNQLATYVGDLPADYAGSEFSLDSLSIPTDLPVSLPSKFVEQRPDVREYSALLHEATAQVGIATANMLPQITITGSYGQEAASFSNIFSAGSNVWSLDRLADAADFQGRPIAASAPRRRRRRAGSGRQLQGHGLTAFQNVSDTLYALQAMRTRSRRKPPQSARRPTA